MAVVMKRAPWKHCGIVGQSLTLSCALQPDCKVSKNSAKPSQVLFLIQEKHPAIISTTCWQFSTEVYVETLKNTCIMSLLNLHNVITRCFMHLRSYPHVKFCSELRQTDPLSNYSLLCHSPFNRQQKWKDRGVWGHMGVRLFHPFMVINAQLLHATDIWETGKANLLGW